MTAPGDWEYALLEEWQKYKRGRRPDQALAVDEELAKRGFAVSAGKLVPIDRTVTAPVTREVKAPEVAAEPKRRGRPPRERAVDPAPERAVDDE